MKMILKVIVAPFALVLALLTALCWFLFDLCAFFLTIASVIVAILGIGLFFTPTPLGRVRVPVPRFPAFSVWLAGGGWLADRSAGRRKIRSVPVPCKLIEPRAMLARSTGGGSGGPPFSLEGRETIWQQPRSCLAMQAKAKP